MTPAKLSLNPPTGLSRTSRWRLPLSCARRGEFTTRGTGGARASGPEVRQLQIGGLVHCPVSCHLIVVSEGGNVGIKKLQQQPNSSGKRRKRSEEAGEDCLHQVTETTAAPPRGTNFIEPLKCMLL